MRLTHYQNNKLKSLRFGSVIQFVDNIWTMHYMMLLLSCCTSTSEYFMCSCLLIICESNLMNLINDQIQYLSVFISSSPPMCSRILHNAFLFFCVWKFLVRFFISQIRSDKVWTVAEIEVRRLKFCSHAGCPSQRRCPSRGDGRIAVIGPAYVGQSRSKTNLTNVEFEPKFCSICTNLELFL